MTNNKDLISIIVPIYNTEQYIDECVDSIKSQTYTNFEAILVDDGSKDSSPAMIDACCKEDERFIAVHKENGGLPSARNAGLDVAKGKYVVFWDSDDTAPADSLENLYNTMVSENADLVIGGVKNFNVFDASEAKSAKVLSLQKEIDKFDPEIIYSISVCNKMFRRDMIEDGGFRFNHVKYFEDGDFITRFLSVCNKIAGCPHVIYNVRVRAFDEGPSITQVGSALMFEHLAGTIEMMRKNLEAIEGDEDKKAAMIDQLYYRFANFNLINLFYRVIWKSKNDFTSLLNEELGKAMRRMSDEKIDRLNMNNPDIDFAKPLKNKEELAANPIFAVVMTSDVPKTRINKMLANLYAMKFPALRILVPDTFKEDIDESYSNRINLHFYEDTPAGRRSLKQLIAPAEFLVYEEQEVYWDENAFIRAYRNLLRNPDCILLRCKETGSNGTKLSNKIFRMSFINKSKLFFTAPYIAIKVIPRKRKGSCGAIAFTGKLEELKCSNAL